MGLFLLLSLGLTADAAKAGAAYREGLEALKTGRYDAAVLKFKEALRHEAGETAKLQYREGAKRRKHAYFPHFEWARARMLQAGGEKNAGGKVKFLQEAVVHLGLTRAPNARTVLVSARAKLAEAEKAVRPSARPEDPFAAPYAALQRKVGALCDRELFVDAFAALEAEGVLFKDHAKEKGEVSAFIRGRQRRVIERYGRLLVLALDNLSAIDPITQGGSAIPFLTRAEIPRAVEPKPDARFRWLRTFVVLYEGELERIRKAPSLEVDLLTKTAAAFDRAAEQALETGSFPGFRAANNVALSIRAARLRTLVDAERGEVEKLLASAEESGRRCGEHLRRRIEKPGADLSAKELKSYKDGVLAARMKEVGSIRQAVEERASEQDQILETIRRAETALVHPDTMADQAALRKLESGLASVQSGPSWVRLPVEMRARSFLARSIAEAIIGLLKGEAKQKVRDRCGALAERAYGLDGKVVSRWRDRLSPKILALLDEIKPQ